MKLRISDYLKLFILREGQVVLGRKLSNVWLLTAVLLATFLAIAFSNGSLNYLNQKMNDPFVKWVEVKKKGATQSFSELERDLSDSTVRARFHCSGFSNDFEYSFFYFGKSDSILVFLRHRFFDIETNRTLIEAILSDDNRIVGVPSAYVDYIDPNTMGVILTERAFEMLGYKISEGKNRENSVPAYVDLSCGAKGVSELGISEIDGRTRVPIPVLGVVKRLPGNADAVGFLNLYSTNDDNRLNLVINEDYASSLCYYLPPEDFPANEFKERLEELLRAETDVDFTIEDTIFDPKELYSFKNKVLWIEEESDTKSFAVHDISFPVVSVNDTVLDPRVCSRVNDKLMFEYAGRDVHRLFKYHYAGIGEAKNKNGDYMSVQFKDLEKIKDFEDEVVNKCGLEIEMAQVNAKENFHSVSVMAITLSVVMVIFSIVCILLFIVNLLRSYFQKIKRNIGTFKAFGISNKELQTVYMVIMLALVCIALVISLVFVSLLQGLLLLLNIQKATGFGYLSLWKCSVITGFPGLITLAAIVFIISASALTVHLVMKNLLSATPGDLIYDR